MIIRFKLVIIHLNDVNTVNLINMYIYYYIKYRCNKFKYKLKGTMTITHYLIVILNIMRLLYQLNNIVCVNV